MHTPYATALQQVTQEASLVQLEWPSFYTLWFLPSPVIYMKLMWALLMSFIPPGLLSLITVLHHTTECIYTLHTCTLCCSSLTGYLRGFSGSVWWPSFYTLWFLHQLITFLMGFNFFWNLLPPSLAPAQDIVVILHPKTPPLWPGVSWLTLQSQPFFMPLRFMIYSVVCF